MITTLTTKGVTATIPIEIEDIMAYRDQWKAIIAWISKTDISITVDKNYYKLRQALIEDDWARVEPSMTMELQFLNSEDKEIYLDKHMEIMWGNII